MVSVLGLSGEDKPARERQFMIDSWLKLNDKYAHAELRHDIMQELYRG